MILHDYEFAAWDDDVLKCTQIKITGLSKEGTRGQGEIKSALS